MRKKKSTGQRIHDYIAMKGLKVRCSQCGARGRFRGWQDGIRLAHVRHDCGGRLRTTREIHRHMDQESRNRVLYAWPDEELAWERNFTWSLQEHSHE